jgi:hypothetical protein
MLSLTQTTLQPPTNQSQQTKSYYLLCDGREDVELKWFRALLDAVKCVVGGGVHADRLLTVVPADDAFLSAPFVLP